LPLGVWGACGGSEFKDSEDGVGDSGAPANGGSTTAGKPGRGGSGAIGAGGGDMGGEPSGGDAGSGARASGGSAMTGGSDSGGSDPTGGDGGNPTGGAGSGNGGNPTGGAGSGNGGNPSGGTGAGNGGNPTGGAGSGGSTGNPTYVDVQLISSCSGPRGEVYDGAWYGNAGGASSFSPTHSDGAFPMTAGGYVGSCARIWGTMAQADYAHVGHNMYRGAAIFNASAYAGVSFYAKAASPISVRVGLGQQNNEPTYGLCTPDVTCYKYPEVTITVGTAWTRHVALFADMQTSPPGVVPTTPGTLKHIQFSMEAGAYDFYVDELYFVARQ
jgi:hypothetical protein